MANEPLATKGNWLHIYDFKVKPGCEEEFIRLFEAFDYGADNPMHTSAAQVKDGVLCRDEHDPSRFFLIAEWRSIEEHGRILPILKDMRPAFIGLIEGGAAAFKPRYVEVVMSTPERILKAAKAI